MDSIRRNINSVNEILNKEGILDVCESTFTGRPGFRLKGAACFVNTCSNLVDASIQHDAQGEDAQAVTVNHRCGQAMIFLAYDRSYRYGMRSNGELRRQV